MNKNKLLLKSIPLLIAILSSSVLHYKTTASAGRTGPDPQLIRAARLSDNVSIRSIARPTASINFSDGHDLLTDYDAASRASLALEDNSASPAALASADFDKDGAQDLICAYRAPGGGVITLHKGNLDSIYPNSPQANQRRASGAFTDAPFLSPARAFELQQSPDFVGAGDFDADGNQDLLVASRGSDIFFLLSGDGQAGFSAPKIMQLPGAVTAVATGEINRADGLTDIVIGILAADGPKALVYENPEGASRATPEVFDLPSQITALALGRADNDYLSDLAVAAGKEVFVIRGTNSQSHTGGKDKTKQTRTSKRRFASAVRSIAIGSFIDKDKPGIAVLTDEGTLHLLGQSGAKKNGKKNDQINRWEEQTLALSARPAELVRARASCAQTESLVAIDQAAHRMYIVASDPYAEKQNKASSGLATLSVATFDVEGGPVAALPIRLNRSALDNLVILRSGQTSPTLMTPQAMMTFIVTTTSDAGVNSFRGAIQAANANPGLDEIRFDVGSGSITINLTGPLPIINDPVNIDGTSQPGSGGRPNVEINGAAVTGDGLIITAGNSNVNGFVLNRFGGSAINLASNNNQVVLNFIGTDPSTLIAEGNGQAGVMVNGSNNVIGFPFLGNVISANGATGVNASGVLINGNANVVQSNFIGTDALASIPLGNSGNGVTIANGAANTIGGPVAGQGGLGNFISGNGSSGVEIFDGAAANLLQGNFIGTDLTGNAPIPNKGDGILIHGSPNNIIGGTAAGAGNVIAFNAFNGVAVAAGTGNSLLSNSIFSNTLLGIDLGNDGVTPNDAGDADAGPNNLQNFPQLTSASVSLGSTFIEGTLNSAPNTTFTLQFFSNTACNPSGFGEGKQLIGTRTVQTDAKGGASISFSFPGNFSLPVTATATDPSGNTSEFSPCAVSAALADLSISKSASPGSVKAGDTLTYTIVVTNQSAVAATNVIVTDDLPGSVTFVSCSTTGNGLCLGSGNNRRVTFGAIPAGASATITLVTTVNALSTSDLFIVNTASVSATNADANPANNSSTALTAVAGAPPLIQCPSNIVLNPTPGLCSVAAQFPLPTITDSRFNLSVTCSPPSGSVFPVGTSTVNCTARDSDVIRAACSFTITVIAPQTLRLNLEGAVQALSFGPAEARRRNKNAPPGCDCDSSFTIENIGCAPLNLTLDSIMRTGSDVTSGRITNPDDSKTFFVSVSSNNQFSDLAIGSIVSIPVGQFRTFRVLFKPRLPVITGKTTGLSAADLLPDLITSKITFRQSGEPIVINLTGRILTDVKLINPDDARGSKRAQFTKSGNEFEVKFGVYDADLDVNRATFEFMDANGRVVQEAFDVDLAQPIREQNINKGQSFVITQRFTGAADHPEVVSVRVKVSDPHSSDTVTERLGSSSASAVATQSVQNSARGAVVLPVRKFEPHP